MHGVVRDSLGGVIVQAEVRAVNKATGEDWEAVSDDVGNYTFVLLPPGLYQIEATANGFKTAVSENVPVRITETITINILLIVGGRVETIMVNASPPLLQTHGPQLGRVGGARAGADLPLASASVTH